MHARNLAVLALLSALALVSTQAWAAGGVSAGTSVGSVTAVTLLSANAGRHGLMCQNNGANQVSAAFGTTATATNGFLLNSAGGLLKLPDAETPGVIGNAMPLTALSALSVSGTNAVVCLEW